MLVQQGEQPSSIMADLNPPSVQILTADWSVNAAVVSPRVRSSLFFLPADGDVTGKRFPTHKRRPAFLAAHQS